MTPDVIDDEFEFVNMSPPRKVPAQNDKVVDPEILQYGFRVLLRRVRGAQHNVEIDGPAELPPRSLPVMELFFQKSAKYRPLVQLESPAVDEEP
jgi:hypothetical protein